MVLTCAVTTNSRQHNMATPNRPARVITPLLNLITKCNTRTTRAAHYNRRQGALGLSD